MSLWVKSGACAPPMSAYPRKRTSGGGDGMSALPGGDIAPLPRRLTVGVFLFENCLRHIPQSCLLGIGGSP